MFSMIGSVLLLVLGLLAAGTWLGRRWPAWARVDQRLQPFSHWLGLVGLVWGVLALGAALLNFSGLWQAPAGWLLALIGSVLLFALGVLFGLELVKGLSWAQPLSAKLAPVRNRLVPAQSMLGLGALAAAGLSLGMVLVGGAGIGSAIAAMPPGMEDCIRTTSPTGRDMIVCPQADAQADAPAGIELRDGEILSNAYADAYMQTNDFAVSLGPDRNERDAYYGRGKTGQFKGDRYYQGINLMGEMSLGHTYKDVNGNVFSLESNDRGHLEVRVHKRVIVEIRPNGEVLREGEKFGQIANVDFNRRSTMLPLLVVAYHRSELFRG
jgi:hypothetical protein